jgi:hypothetical protein
VPTKETRRHQRSLYTGPVRVSWEESGGLIKYTEAKCLDVSEGGLRMEARVLIPRNTSVTLRVERINLAGSASVKHVARRGSKFVLGLRLSSELRAGVLSLPPAPPAAG